MHIDYQQIGSRIKQVRKRRGLTQEQLAEKMYVSVGYISQLERGVTKINLDTLGEIATLLNCEITHFISGVTPEQNCYLVSELSAALQKLTSRDRRLLLTLAEAMASQE